MELVKHLSGNIIFLPAKHLDEYLKKDSSFSGPIFLTTPEFAEKKIVSICLGTGEIFQTFCEWFKDSCQSKDLLHQFMERICENREQILVKHNLDESVYISVHIGQINSRICPSIDFYDATGIKMSEHHVSVLYADFDESTLMSFIEEHVLGV